MLQTMKFVFEVILDGARFLPAAFVIFWNSFVAVVPQITMILAFIYLVLQITHLTWKWRTEYSEKKAARKNKRERASDRQRPPRDW